MKRISYCIAPCSDGSKQSNSLVVNILNMETLNHLWSPAPKDLILADHEVHVW